MSDSSRLPLQTGATMLRRIAWTSLSVAAMASLVALYSWATAPKDTGQLMFSWQRDAVGWTGAFAAVYWLYFLPITSAILFVALGGARASDCVLDRSELRIEGGKYDRFQMAWSSISGGDTAVDSQGTLNLDLGAGVRVPIAVATDVEERRSVDALVSVIRERQAGGAPAAKETIAADDSVGPKLLLCGNCGAHAPIDEAQSVNCHSCGASVPMPEDVRSRVHAARAAREGKSEVDALVLKLLTQPDAKKVNGQLAVMVVIGVLWLPLPAMTGSWPTMALSAALTVFVGFLAHRTIADRRAVRLLTLDFAAHGAMVAGEPHRCRCCGGPLPTPADDGIVVSCIYCDAENVLGIDMHHRARAARSAERTLSSTLAERQRARTRASVALAAAATATLAVLIAWVATR